MAKDPQTLADLGIPATSRRAQLLTTLADCEGYPNVLAMLEAATCDSIVPGICPKCGYIDQTEPDARDNWCEDCNKPSVISCLVLANIL